MTRRAVLPGDLAIAPDDPFAGLEPGRAHAPWRSFSLTAPRLFCSKVFRRLGAREGEAAARRIGGGLAEGDYEGLVLDYRGAVIKADPDASRALADASAAAFPRGVLVGYLSDAPSAPYTKLMTTLLRDRGVKAARAGDFDTLYGALVGRLTIPVE